MLSKERQATLFYNYFLSYKNKRKYINAKIPEKTLPYFNIFPYRKFEETALNDFKIACIYHFITNGSLSLTSNIEAMNYLDIKDVYKFKKKLINYQTHILTDINYLKENPDILNEALKGNIELFTFVFLYDIETLNNRVYKNFYLKCRFIKKYLNFNKEFIDYIKNLYHNSI